MHLGLLCLTITVAAVVRWRWKPGLGTWSQRWWWAVLALCCPIFGLFSTAIAILGMGHHGTMLGWAVGPTGCRISQLVLIGGLMAGLYGVFQAGWTTWRWRQYPLTQLPQGIPARLIDTEVPIAAQVGFWRSALMVSRGWLDQLSSEEQAMVLAHEQAHAYYRDPLGFWLLGMVRQLTAWLPCTQALWQELLLLREIRADRWAAQQAHPLAVAELLVKMSRQTILEKAVPSSALIGFSSPDEMDRLEQRVDALLEPMPSEETPPLGKVVVGFTLTLLPLLAMGLHH
ncbi:MAG: M56 family metallopeptidase [Spirulina sp.]